MREKQRYLVPLGTGRPTGVDSAQKVDQGCLRNLMPETKCVLRQKRSTSGMIFVSRQAMEEYREKNHERHMCFIDLSKAFDTVATPIRLP